MGSNDDSHDQTSYRVATTILRFALGSVALALSGPGALALENAFGRSEDAGSRGSEPARRREA